MNNRKLTGGALTRRNALTVALAVGLGFTGVAFGQATTGTIFGTAPAAAGQTIQVKGPGVSRTVTVGQNGRYSVSNLPVGTYTVTLSKSGQTVSTRQNINISVGAGTEVDFAQSATQLSAVQVNANALPSIDVSTVTSSTVITASDLEKLPVGRSAESIALLAPNTVQGSSYFGNLVSFGGSGVAENAYYVNGYNTGDPFKNLGGYSLPYGAISQQQTITGGFGAKYGRSDGGVINQIGKRGTNEWHFGAQVAWEPGFLRADRQDTYYPTGTPPAPYTWNNTSLPGTLYRNGHADSRWQTIYSAYVGGPLIKDKLYFFAAGEVTHTSQTNVSSNSSGNGTIVDSSNHQTKMYGKVDWNINDNNVLEGTILQVNNSNGAGGTFDYNYNTLTRGAFKSPNSRTQDNARYLVAHYTSYISDNATLSVLWGSGQFSNPTFLGNRSTAAYITGLSNQPTSQWVDGKPVSGPQTVGYQGAPDASDGNHGLRADFTYVLGNHTLGVGIDNMYYSAHNQGQYMTGPGYWWQYRSDTVVRKYYYRDLTSMKTAQKAYYLQDVWQATPNLQLNLGLRNDHYINYNDLGLPFVNMKNQWEPRLGFSWDVNGDSSFKVYGNVGRYYLALPQSVAKRAANRSSYLWTYYTYTGVDPSTGAPTGLTQTGSTGSPDGENGTPKDPRQVSATNLRPQYIDEYVLGFDKKLGDNWVYGAKATYRHLGTVIDDECDPGAIAKKMTSMGLDPYGNYYDSLFGAAYCRLINPGQSNNILVQSASGEYRTITMTTKDWGFKQKPKRKYASLNLYLEHPFDGKWYGRIDYTYTNATGNTAGQTRPDFGQADISKTEDWDHWQLMQGADGQLLNSRKNVFRIRGAYQLTPEWLLSTTAIIASGTPEECLGYFGPAGTLYNDPTYYGPDYHWCNGQIVHPGSNSPLAGHTPWQKTINLGVRYTPAFADKKLSFKLDIFNVLNSQTATQTDPTFDAGTAYHPYYGTTTTYKMSNTFHMPISYTPPRSVRLTVSYDY
jgi:outer membrane receptor protein involved in Fe transport